MKLTDRIHGSCPKPDDLFSMWQFLDFAIVSGYGILAHGKSTQIISIFGRRKKHIPMNYRVKKLCSMWTLNDRNECQIAHMNIQSWSVTHWPEWYAYDVCLWLWRKMIIWSLQIIRAYEFDCRLIGRMWHIQ